MITKGQNSSSETPCGPSSVASTPGQPSSEDASDASLEPNPAPVDSIRASSLDPDTFSALDSLCKEYRDLSSRISKLTEDQKTTKEAIESLALTLNVKKITSPLWCTVKGQKTTTSLDKETMFEECTKNNLDPGLWWTIYEASLKEKKGKEFISVLEGVEEQPEVDLGLFD